VEATWTDVVSATSAAFTALLTLLLVVAAFLAWRTAKSTLEASRRASEAAEAASLAAAQANEQARLDSIERTRPYVFVEIAPSLAGRQSYDIRIRNAGQSAARDLRLEYDRWPDEIDDVATSVRQLFATPRTLPPGCSIRALWRLEGQFTDGTNEAGLGKTGRISVRYTGASPELNYTDTFDVQIAESGLWPAPEEGPRPDNLRGELRTFYLLGQTLVRRIGELGR
jgi:hypothetical protein